MQERGVSKRVEVRFDQVGDDGEIDSKAIKDAPAEPHAEQAEEPAAEVAPKESPKPSGALRAALASMREDDAKVSVD
jgi:hypothetical protein